MFWDLTKSVTSRHLFEELFSVLLLVLSATEWIPWRSLVYFRLPDDLTDTDTLSNNSSNYAGQYKVNSSLMGTTLGDSGQACSVEPRAAQMFLLYLSRPSKVQGESWKVHSWELSRNFCFLAPLDWRQYWDYTVPLIYKSEFSLYSWSLPLWWKQCWQQEQFPSSKRNQIKFFWLLLIFLKINSSSYPFLGQ